MFKLQCFRHFFGMLFGAIGVTSTVCFLKYAPEEVGVFVIMGMLVIFFITIIGFIYRLGEHIGINLYIKWFPNNCRLILQTYNNNIRKDLFVEDDNSSTNQERPLRGEESQGQIKDQLVKRYLG